MKTVDEDQIVALLAGRKSKRIEEMKTEGVLPPFLIEKYSRESAALQAAELNSLSPTLVAALLRAAFLDEDEDVRTAARGTLIRRDPHVGDAVHLALTMDEDPELRELALDQAEEIDDPGRRQVLINRAVKALENDECERIRSRVKRYTDQ